MGLVDGPGVRTVFFLQGCPLRCKYCHNPDTWAQQKGEMMFPQQVVEKLLRFKPYYGTQGGVTFSGGEPLLQKDFLLDTLKLCKENGIHTCIDTSGVGKEDVFEVLPYTDLLLLDIKHYTEEGYFSITGHTMHAFNTFLTHAQQLKTPLILRHVVVPSLTDSKEHMEGLLKYVMTLQNVVKVELLPYHVLGAQKYASLSLPYPLKDVPPMDKEKVQAWQKIFDQTLLINQK